MNLDFFLPSSDNVFAKEAAAVNPPEVWGAQEQAAAWQSILRQPCRWDSATSSLALPRGKHPPAQLSSQAVGDSMSGLAGRLSESINTTLVARAGSEAG